MLCKGYSVPREDKDLGTLHSEEAALGGPQQCVKWKQGLKSLFFFFPGCSLYNCTNCLRFFVTIFDSKQLAWWLWCHPCRIVCSFVLSKGPNVGDGSSTGWVNTYRLVESTSSYPKTTLLVSRQQLHWIIFYKPSITYNPSFWFLQMGLLVAKGLVLLRLTSIIHTFHLWVVQPSKPRSLNCFQNTRCIEFLHLYQKISSDSWENSLLLVF